MLEKSPPNADLQSGGIASLADASSLAVLIVGMHRSGTSALSGVLHKLGVAVPEDLHPADEHNARGYFEPQRVIQFHERLLATLGSPSDDPLPLSYDWVRSPIGEAAAEELAEILDEEFAASPMCLFKDPRICRLMPVWSAALRKSGRAGAAILPYRDPLEVAGSLAAKAGLGRPYALFMWLQHVLLGERFTRHMARSFTGYDDLMGDWRAVSAKLQRELGVSWPRDAMRAGPDVDAFLSRELRHHVGRAEALEAQEPLDGLCQRTWAALRRFDVDPYDDQAQAEFDAIWAELEAAFGVFGPLVVEYQRTEQRLESEKDALAAQQDREILARDDIIHRQAEVIEDQAAHHARLTEQAEALRTNLRTRDRELRDVIRRAEGGEREIFGLQHDIQGLQAELRQARDRLHNIETSTIWALSYPLRQGLIRFPQLRRAVRGGVKLLWWSVSFKLGRKLRERALAGASAEPQKVAATLRAVAPPAAQPLPRRTAGAALSPAGGRAPTGQVLFVSGEAHTPGHRYRVLRNAEAAERAGMRAVVISTEQVMEMLHEVRASDFVFLWRAAWQPDIEALYAAAKEAGVPVVFDTDDLMFDPELATEQVIDGIRSQGFEEKIVAEFFGRVRQAAERADFCTAPTPFLARKLRHLHKPALVLPNGFDEDVFVRSRLAARTRRQQGTDGLLRIGYATGSRTHQRDFAQCAAAVADVLRAHPHARLVLFMNDDGPVLDIAEFPAFDGLEGQIEWRMLVPIEQLPEELARFDISIAPVEVGNPFCEAKSELKFFEAALVDVPTIASPTEPFRLAICDGETGFLAGTREQWLVALTRLVEDADLRRNMARTALLEALAHFGPERRVETFVSLADQLLPDARRGARSFELDLLRAARDRRPAPYLPPHEVVFERDRLRPSEVTVIVPLYNYGRFVVEALESVRGQTLVDIDLIVIDDASTDDSHAIARAWLESNAERFNRVQLIRNRQNAGLGFTRNVGFANAETPYVLPLDADNRLRPHCAQRLIESINASYAAFAYPVLRQFGDSDGQIGWQSWAPARFIEGNYIDAMALVRRAAWADAGGYDHVRYGWEDFDFWCRLVERGQFGVHVADFLADYRVHGGSMLRTETEVHRNKLRLLDDMERRHPWLRLERPERPPVLDSEPQAEPAPAAAAGELSAPLDEARLERLLPLLRCPETGKPLERTEAGLRAVGTDKVWPLVRGRPALFPGLDEPRVFPQEHVSNALPERAVELIEATPGLVLNLSAGGSARRYDHVVEAEFAVFRHTDVLADAHRLPFADGSFDLVVSMNAFEHYHSPRQAADEIMRVLKPGGRVLIRTAFLQPLHEAPWHFYNCTRHGLERWFEAFEAVDLQVSDNFNPVHAIAWQLSEAEQLLSRELSPADAARFAAASAQELITLWRDPASRESPLWRRFFDIPREAQEGLAAGFEYLGRKPE